MKLRVMLLACAIPTVYISAAQVTASGSLNSKDTSKEKKTWWSKLWEGQGARSEASHDKPAPVMQATQVVDRTKSPVPEKALHELSKIINVPVSELEKLTLKQYELLHRLHTEYETELHQNEQQGGPFKTLQIVISDKDKTALEKLPKVVQEGFKKSHLYYVSAWDFSVSDI